MEKRSVRTFDKYINNDKQLNITAILLLSNLYLEQGIG